MALDCLYDYIGIAGCNSTAPPSGLYINSLAGISLSALEKLSKDESPTFLAVWNDIQRRAIRRMQLEVSARFARRFKIRNIDKNYNLERDVTPTTVTAASAQYRGVVINGNYYTDQTEVKRSALTSIYIQTIEFYSLATGSRTIKVFDTFLSTVIGTFTFTAAVGWNTVQVNTTYDARSVFIAMDCTLIGTAYKYAPSTLQKYPVNVQGGTMGVAANTSTIATGSNLFGFGGVFGVRCKFDPIVCNNLDQFATPFSYLCASEMMMERLSSNRINNFTVDKTQATELKAHYDVEFEKSIGMACDYIQLDIYDDCLECNAQTTIRESNFFQV